MIAKVIGRVLGEFFFNLEGLKVEKLDQNKHSMLMSSNSNSNSSIRSGG